MRITSHQYISVKLGYCAALPLLLVLAYVYSSFLTLSEPEQFLPATGGSSPLEVTPEIIFLRVRVALLD